jgi:hypothetical protein
MANKRYDQFTTATPTTSRISLHADAATGALNKCTIGDILNLSTATGNIATILQALGSPIKGITGDRTVPDNLAAANMASQTIFLAAVYLPACTVTGITFLMNTPGIYTANNYNGVGLYSYSAPTATLVASSTNDGNMWKQSGNNNYQKAFTSTAVITAGVYFAAYLYCSSAQTTAPQLYSYPVYNGTGMNAWFTTNNTRVFGSIASQTTLPSTINMSTSTVSINAGFVSAVY